MTYNKIIVLYYSRSGHSRRVAEEISRKLNCDLQGIYSLTDYPQGIWGFQKALFHTAINKKISIQIGKRDLKSYDLVLVGSPIWFGRMAQPVRRFLDEYKDQIQNLGFFATQDGTTGAERVFEQMSKVAMKKPVVTLKVFSSEIKNETFQKKVSQFADLFKPLPRKPERRPPTEIQPSAF